MESNWISVKDSLPTDCQEILFYTQGYINNAIRLGIFVEKDHWDRPNMFIGDGFFHVENVSHWMPSPKSPQITNTTIQENESGFFFLIEKEIEYSEELKKQFSSQSLEYGRASDRIAIFKKVRQMFLTLTSPPTILS